jgi:hypothetical protein
MGKSRRQCGSIDGRSSIWLVLNSLHTKMVRPGECREVDAQAWGRGEQSRASSLARACGGKGKLSFIDARRYEGEIGEWNSPDRLA